MSGASQNSASEAAWRDAIRSEAERIHESAMLGANQDVAAYAVGQPADGPAQRVGVQLAALVVRFGLPCDAFITGGPQECPHGVRVQLFPGRVEELEHRFASVASSVTASKVEVRNSTAPPSPPRTDVRPAGGR